MREKNEETSNTFSYFYTGKHNGTFDYVLCVWKIRKRKGDYG